MQANSTRYPPENGPPQPTSRAPSASRLNIVTNGYHTDLPSPFHSPQTPVITTNSANFSRNRFPSPVTNGNLPALTVPEISQTTGIPPRSASSGPFLRKTTSNQSIGNAKRVRKASVKDLVAEFNFNKGRDVQPGSLVRATTPLGSSINASFRNKSATFLPFDPPPAIPSELRGAMDHESSITQQEGPVQDLNLRLDREVSNTSSMADNHLGDLQGWSQLQSSPFDLIAGGVTQKDSNGTPVDSVNDHANAQRSSEHLTPNFRSPGKSSPHDQASPNASVIESHSGTRSQNSPTSLRSRIPVRSSPHLSHDGSPVSVKRTRSELTDNLSPSPGSRRSLTPPGRFYSTRYEVSPTRPVNSGDRVKAIITAPATKSSPPLRSSRPRQHISSARSASPSTPRTPFQPGNSPKVSSNFGPDSEHSAQSPEKENILTQLSNAVYHRSTPPPKLTIDVKDMPKPAGHEPTTGTTEFEEDSELHHDEMPGSFPNDMEAAKNITMSVSVTSGIVQSERLTAEELSALPGSKELDPYQHADASGTVLNKIMELRQRSSVLLSGVLGSLPSSPQRGSTSPMRTTAPSGPQSPIRSGAATPASDSMTPVRRTMSPVVDPQFLVHAPISPIIDSMDGGTIPIMLSDVPGLTSSHKRNWKTRDRVRRSRTQDSFTSPSKSLTPSRGNAKVLSPGTGSPAKRNVSRTAGRYTLDSDSYSVINRVLDQYHEIGAVTEEMVQSFQQHILETDPDLATRPDIDSLSIARVALEDLIRDHSNSSLFSSKSQSQSSLIRNYSESDVARSATMAPSFDGFGTSPAKQIQSSSTIISSVPGGPSYIDEPEKDVFGESVPLSNVATNRQLSNLTNTRSRHYSMADQIVPASQTQSQSTRDPDNSADDDVGPTPPPKDPKYPILNKVERNMVLERPPTNERNLQQQQNGSNVPSKRPLLPEIPSTDGGLGLFNTPRPSEDSISGQRSTNFAYSSSTSFNGGSSAQQGQPSALLQPIPNSMKAPTPTSTSNSLRTISRQTTRESTPKATPAPSIAPTIDPKSQEPPGQPALPLVAQEAASEERPFTPRAIESAPTTEQRRLTKRRHLIKELVDTEFSFNQDMKVIEDIYKGTASAVEALTPDDRRILFGNSAQIVEFSESFLDNLKHASASVYVMPRTNKWRIKRGSLTSTPNPEEQASPGNPEPTDEDRDRKTFLGEAFGQHMGKMEKVYGDYLRNHDLANQRLSRLQNVPQVNLWLNECHTYASDITSAWDLDSLLVKPVQRILKYPLLLKSLLEETHPDHPDHSALETAVKQMMDVSYRINESKKRAELLDQVVNRPTKRKDYDVSNALSKAFGRRTDKLKQQVGMSDAVEDPEYKAISEKFGGQFFQLQVVMRDMEMYKKTTEDFIKQYNRYIEAIEDMIDVGHNNSPDIEAKWRRLALTIREMTAIAYMDHEAAVRKHCIDPMIILLKMHDGPQRLMQKRKKRIVEYAKYLTVKNRGEKPDKKTQEQGEQFIALNETLKDELPKLFALTAKLVQACLRNYVDIQAQWHATWQRKIKAMLKEQRIPKDISEIVEAFHADFAYTEAQVLSLSICNGTLLSDVSFMMSSASTILGTDDSSSTKKRPSVITKTDSTVSVHTLENNSQSPVLPHPDFVNKRRSNGSSTFAIPMSFNSPRTSTENHRLSYHSSSNVPMAPSGSTSPQRANRARTASAASMKQPFNTTPPIPQQRMSQSTTVAYGPYTPNSTNQRASGSSRPLVTVNTRGNPSSNNPRLSASSAKSAALSAASFAHASHSNVPLSSAIGSTGTSTGSNQWSAATSPNLSTARSSGVFNSALPISDTPPDTPGAPTPTGAGLSMAGRISNVIDSSSLPSTAGAHNMSASVGPSTAKDRRSEHDRTRESSEQTRSGQREHHAVGGGGNRREHRVLFLAASLFEFNIDRSRKEAGFPYLTYIPGEIFDVIAEKGELWLARNQDDPGGLIGWIWEKHFAKLMREGNQ